MIWKDEEEAVCAKMKVIIENGHNHKKSAEYNLGGTIPSSLNQYQSS